MRALAEGLDVRTNAPVNRIVRTPGSGVEVTTPSGTFRAAAVIVTVPIPVLQRGLIEFVPPLPIAKTRAIASLECEPALKMCAKFAKRFWPPELHGMVCSDSFAPELWFDVGPSHDARGAVCEVYYVTAFFTSDQARRVAELETDAAFGSLLAQMSEMFEAPARTHYLGGFIIDWGRVPYIWGGYTTPSLSEAADARQAVGAPVDGQIFFAGEGTDPNAFMTAHAAMQTGLRAARESMQAVLAVRMRSVLALHTAAASPLSRL